MNIVHTPVLLQECLTLLSPVGESYEDTALMVDSTLGEGGHTNAFLEKYPKLHVIGLDRDSSIQQKAKCRLAQYGDRVHFYNTWFNDFYKSYPDFVQTLSAESNILSWSHYLVLLQVSGLM